MNDIRCAKVSGGVARAQLGDHEGAQRGRGLEGQSLAVQRLGIAQAVIGQDKHEELLARNGFYAELYNSQFERAIA